MLPVKTSVEDMQKILDYLSRQVGWVELPKMEKSLGARAIDSRKIATMVALGLLFRDDTNIKATPRGLTVQTNQEGALRESIAGFELYRATVEWLHYGGKSLVTAVEIGQYWESTHGDTLDGKGGDHLKDGAICFSRVMEGAGMGKFFVGRAGKETRLEIDQSKVRDFVDKETSPEASSEENALSSGRENQSDGGDQFQSDGPSEPRGDVQEVPVSVSASPNVHVNVEIHIAADATADTVKQIFRNMARYVLDKDVDDAE